MDVFVNLWFSVKSFKITKLKVYFNLIHKKTTVFGSVAREYGTCTHHIYINIHIYMHIYTYTHVHTYLCAHVHTHTQI